MLTNADRSFTSPLILERMLTINADRSRYDSDAMTFLVSNIESAAQQWVPKLEIVKHTSNVAVACISWVGSERLLAILCRILVIYRPILRGFSMDSASTVRIRGTSATASWTLSKPAARPRS